jgi:hypothetical protein
VVSNGAGSATSSAATLVVIAAPAAQAPAISTQPATAVALPGGSATLAVAANGSAPLAYQWSRNGTPLAGATGAVLQLANITAQDAGSYTVSVSNSVGSVSSAAAQVIVVGAPVVTQQPAAASAAEGSAATFRVSATGDALRYQWTRNNVAIAGATSATYTTPALTLVDNGAVFGVIVYNGAGLVMSEGAGLTVTTPPPPTPTAGIVSLTPGGGVPNHDSQAPSVSGDGRYVAFQSLATDLVPGVSETVSHAYVRDLSAASTTRVDVTPAGAPSSRGIVAMKLAAGGRHVVFTSFSNDLVAGDTNTALDTFVRDLQTGTTVRSNVLPDGSQDTVSGNGLFDFCDISGDGRFVLMRAGVDLAGSGAPLPDGYGLFLRDMQAGTTRQIGAGSLPLSASGLARVSTDGGTVVIAESLTHGATQVRMVAYDIATGTLATVFSADINTIGGFSAISISDDASHIAFTSMAATPFGSAQSSVSQVWVHDRIANTMTLASTGAQGIGDRGSNYPVISGDDRSVAFVSNATNLTGSPNTLNPHLMFRDLVTGTLSVASRRASGGGVIVPHAPPALTRDAAAVFFSSRQYDWEGVPYTGTNGSYVIVRVPRP